MILEILIFLLTTLVAYYLYSYKKLHTYFKDRGVKFLPGVPLFGNVFGSSLMLKHSLEDLDTVYYAFPDEKYVGYIEMTTPILIIRDPELIKNITVKDFDHFVDHRQFINGNVDPLFSSSLVFMQGDRWRDMRSTLSPAFTAAKMKNMMPLILETSNNIIEYLNEHTNENLDVDDLMRRYTNDVIASAGFGLQVNSVKDRENEFFMAGKGLFDFTFKQQMVMTLDSLCPILIKMLGWRLFEDRIYNFFTNVVASTLEYRKKENVKRLDMIQLLMEAKQEWSAIDLTSQVFIFFSAGFETSATTLTMTIHEMALNPEVQDKLYQECREFQKELTFDNMSELKYLDCVINETLRKWSPAIIMDRTCTKTYELPPPREGGKPYVLNPGDVVYNMVNQLHLDAKYYPDPHKYDPDRFSEENKQNNKAFTHMPFGSGPRICIGMRFAMMELKVLLYHLILNFKIVKTEKTQDPVKILPHSFNIKVAGGTHVKFEKRLAN